MFATAFPGLCLQFDFDSFSGISISHFPCKVFYNFNKNIQYEDDVESVISCLKKGMEFPKFSVQLSLEWKNFTLLQYKCVIQFSLKLLCFCVAVCISTSISPVAKALQ